MADDTPRVTISRSTLHAVMIVGYVGAILAGGLTSGLLLRAGVPAGIGHGTGFLLIALLLYPGMRAWTELREVELATFARWAAVWTITAVVGYGLAYPLVARAIDRLI